MAKIIAVNSFRRGTGKTTLAANICALLTAAGQRVGALDADIEAPSLHYRFKMREDETHPTLNHYLLGECTLESTVYDVTERLGSSLPGSLYLVPASTDAHQIGRVLSRGLDLERLNYGFQDLVKVLKLDVLVIDTHAGLNETALLAVAISDALAVVMRPDLQDYQGTGLTIDVIQKLGVPQLGIVINHVPASVPMDELSLHVRSVFHCQVAGALAHSNEMLVMGSDGVFALQYPDHVVTHQMIHAARFFFG